MNNLANQTRNTLQKQIPKKPPPPTPIIPNSTTTITTNATSPSSQSFLPDQLAPALPPKPANQFNHHQLQNTNSLNSIQQSPQLHHQPLNQQVLEQARVIYCYKPNNPDELELKLNDVINVLEKEIEDLGWWKGELNGKVGLFPDNFVELIKVPTTSQANNNQDWIHGITPPLPVVNQQSTLNYGLNNSETKVKSVFAATPKGFSRELESNLEKHSSPANFLSLKRDKIQHLQQQQHQQQSPSLLRSQDLSSTPTTENGKEELEPTGKLNHITANRAKGPTRKPPSNILSRRNQLDQHSKKEPTERDEAPLNSLPMVGIPSTANHDSLLLLPTNQNTSSPLTSLTSKFSEVQQPQPPMKPSLSLDNVVDSQAPKTTIRAPQPQLSTDDKSKTVSTPMWMVELKKAQAEKKRDTPATSTISQEDELVPIISASTPQVTANSLPKQLSSKNIETEFAELKSEVARLRDELHGFSDLKQVVESIRTELKACQSATENQRRYIRDLVNNLADERKKIALMQVEIDRNLK